jgi:NAD(P)-dependent dehydrogenase (short-subunit alcohol dehydrogenase family)
MSGVLVVTGAGRGIGAACARVGARAGYKVCVNYGKSRIAAETVVKEIVAAGGDAVAIGADVGKTDDVKRLFAEVDRRLGPVTALINNAGVPGRVERIDAYDEAALDEIFAVNTFSIFYCCREAIRRMSTKHGGKGGAIVNISSAAARLGGLPNMVAYAASKGAVDSFTLGLAKEVGREGIRVTGIRPGLILTDILDAAGTRGMVDSLIPTLPLARAGAPDEIAEAAIWLLSDAASYVHGTTIDVSGGR